MLCEEEENRILYLDEQGLNYVEIAFDIADRRQRYINIDRELYEEIMEILKNGK